MPNYTLRQLKTFFEVAKLGSVSKAAEKLFITQPAVSMQLRQLEDEFGIALFENVGRNIRLTKTRMRARADSRCAQSTDTFSRRLVNNS